MSKTTEIYQEEYKGFLIKEETEPWAITYGWNYRFFRDDNLHGGKTLEQCKDQIDEMTSED